MSGKSLKVKESKSTYTAKRKSPVGSSSSSRVTLRWSEVEGAAEPIILQREGQPVAVVLRYEEYRQLNAARAERREKAWQEMEALLAKVHARTRGIPPEEIEADITAARQEVREQHAASRSRG